MKPSIGRIVHYTPPEDEDDHGKGDPYPAIITHVWGETCVNLYVFPDGSFTGPGVGVVTSVTEGDSLRQKGTWSWPPRVEG